MNLDEYLMNKNKNMDDYVFIFWLIINYVYISVHSPSLLFYLCYVSISSPVFSIWRSLTRCKETIRNREFLREYEDRIHRRREEILHRLPEIPPRLTEENIHSFPIKPIPSSGQECPIAHDEIPKNENCYILQCGHTFGEGIVEWWIYGNRRCPMCRRVIIDNF